MYLYLNNEEVQMINALLTEKALWLCNKQIELLKADEDHTEEYESVVYCTRVVDGILDQINDLSKHID